MSNKTKKPILKSLIRSNAFGLLSAVFISSCGQTTPAIESQETAVAEAPIAPSTAASSVSNTIETAKPALNGAKLYKRCSACHLPTGKGVVGAFPPLNGQVSGLLNSELGKEYFTLVAYYGLAGTIEASGQSYSGIMPAQGGMNPDKAAATLNYIMQEFNGVADDDPRLFTADFVAATITKYGRLSGAKVHALRMAAYESVQR